YYIFVALVFVVLYALNKVDFNQVKFDKDKDKEIASSETHKSEEAVLQTSSGPYFLPTSTTHQIIEHATYYLSYSEDHEQAEWVAYELKPEHLSGEKRKRPYFNQDP